MPRSLRATLAIAGSTALEAVRNRIVFSAAFFVVVLIGASVAAASVALGDRARIVVDVGLAATSIASSLMAVALSVSSFARELDRRTAYPVLARPLPRWAFVLGKYLGLVAVVATLATTMTLATALVVLVFGAPVPSALWASIPVTWAEVALVTALALAFSTFAAPALAATYSACLVIAGSFTADVASLASRAEDPASAAVLRALYYLLPDLQALSVRSQAANDLPVGGAFVAAALLYGATYAATALFIAITAFERRRAL